MSQLSESVERKIIETIPLHDLEIETDSGWHDVSALHKTIKYVVWEIETSSGKTLRCADTHILFNENMTQVYAKDIVQGSFVQTSDDPEQVVRVVQTSCREHMYDLTVDSDDHRFYSNGILSHNTTILNALCYALYGQALTNIKLNNLINHRNSKNMLVSVVFTKGHHVYKIERGRKPNIFKLYADDQETGEETDQAQGENRQTQERLTRILGMSYSLFKHLVALNTYTEPFLSLSANVQREMIEELLGIGILSEKALALKEQVKNIKDQITEQDILIRAAQSSNEKIEKSINDLEYTSKTWDKQHNLRISKLEKQIIELCEIDIDKEIQSHKDLSNWKEYNTKKADLKRQEKSLLNTVTKDEKALTKAETDLLTTKDRTCYACGQFLHDESHEKILDEKQTTVNSLKKDINNDIKDLESIQEQLDQLKIAQDKPKTEYDSLEEAYEHHSTMTSCGNALEREMSDTNPYESQIKHLRSTGIQNVDVSAKDDLTTLKDHYDFLIKLLTNKDSFIRKQIIDQNLAYLNRRLGAYLEAIGLPHDVKFQNDLSVEITDLGRDLDFDNLSRGERNRLILSLNWAFRDVFESLNHSINVLFIDELIDNGTDQSGVDAALDILKGMVRERGKDIFLVSHRDELIGRVSNVLTVTKENNFTTFEQEISE